MGRKDSHLVKNLEGYRVSVPLRHRVKSEIELEQVGGRGIQLPPIAIMQFLVVYLRTLHILSFLIRFTSFGS